MTSFSPRRRAVALLCAALVLVATCAYATSIAVQGDVSQTGSTFDGDTISFDLSSSSPSVVTVQLVSSTVSGSGLAIQGYSGTVPASITSRVSMSVTSTTVTDSTISFTGVMPPNSDIRLASTTGTLSSAKSLFDFSGLQLSGNVTVTVEDSSVTWPSDSTNTGSVVTYTTGTTDVLIKNLAALFILNATATNGASVLHIDTTGIFSITESSALAVDYGRCDGCSSSMVDIGVPLKVDGSSMFRVTQGTVVNGAKGLVSSAGSVTVSDKSLYLISDSTIESGSFFNLVTGADSDAPIAFNFDVSTSSTVSFYNLVGPSTGVPAGTTIPSSNDGTCAVNAGQCTIGGTALTTAAEYESNGFKVTSVVNADGAASGTCANVKCVPGNSNAGIAEVSGTACACACSSSTASPPSCTSVSDPTQSYNSNVATCTIENCANCDRLYPTSRCTACTTGYELNTNYQCQKITTTTTPRPGESTTTTTTTTPAPTTTSTTSTTTTAFCSVAYCSRCKATDGSTCASCRNGYKLNGGSCIANFNGASAAQSALFAAVVCAAAVYAL